MPEATPRCYPIPPPPHHRPPPPPHHRPPPKPKPKPKPKPTPPKRQTTGLPQIRNNELDTIPPDWDLRCKTDRNWCRNFLMMLINKMLVNTIFTSVPVPSLRGDVRQAILEECHQNWTCFDERRKLHRAALQRDFLLNEVAPTESLGNLIGGIIGGLVILFILAVAIHCFCCARKSKGQRGHVSKARSISKNSKKSHKKKSSIKTRSKSRGKSLSKRASKKSRSKSIKKGRSSSSKLKKSTSSKLKRRSLSRSKSNKRSKSSGKGRALKTDKKSK